MGNRPVVLLVLGFLASYLPGISLSDRSGALSGKSARTKPVVSVHPDDLPAVAVVASWEGEVFPRTAGRLRVPRSGAHPATGCGRGIGCRSALHAGHAAPAWRIPRRRHSAWRGGIDLQPPW